MEILHSKGEQSSEMVEPMCKMLDTLGKRSLMPSFLLLILAFLATPAWSEPREYGTKEALYRDHETYGVHKVQQRWLVQNDRGTQRKSSQGLSPEEKSRLNGKIKKWKSLPPEEQNRLRYRMKEYKQLPSQDRALPVESS